MRLAPRTKTIRVEVRLAPLQKQSVCGWGWHLEKNNPFVGEVGTERKKIYLVGEVDSISNQQSVHSGISKSSYLEPGCRQLAEPQ